MTSKLPWAAVAIIVVAAIGAWTLWGQAPAAPPTPGPSTITGYLGPGTAFAAYPDNSGIEAIYIMPTGTVYTENMADHTDNDLGTISSSGASVDIPYNTSFDICVAVSGHTDNMGSLTDAYMMVALGATTATADWSIPYENSDDNATIDEHTFHPSDGTWVRFNVVWDNNGTGYKLAAHDNLSITTVDLWLEGQVS